MFMIVFNCAACGKSLKVKDEFAGHKGRCPHCEQPMTVPSGAEATPERADGSGDYSPSDAQTIPPFSPGAQLDSKTLMPSVPRGGRAPQKGNTNFPSGAGMKAPKRELYDFLAPSQAADEIGRLGSYRVLKVLGAGGMGVVFQAEDPALNRLVALKAMLPALAASGSNKERFLREARAAAAIEHDHIVAIYQVAEDRGVPFIAMPFLRGESLEDRLQRERELPLPEVLRIAKESAEGLAAAHDRAMIHRDIKPANIWLEGEKGRVKILDFGLARSERGQAQLTQQGTIVGTPAYMAPEQAAGKQVDSRCDLFSLGCVLYRMATGQLPFQGTDTVSTLVAVATETPKPPRKLNPEITPGLSKLIMDLLAKDPKDRPPSALTVVDMIDELANEPLLIDTALDEPIDRLEVLRDAEDEVRTPPPSRRIDKWRAVDEPAEHSSKLPLLIGGGIGVGVLVLIGLIGLLVFALKDSDTPQVARSENPPVDSTPLPQPPVVKPNPPVNPTPKPNPPADSGASSKTIDPVKRPSDSELEKAKPKPQPKKTGPREADKTFKPYSSGVKGLVIAPDGKHFFSHSDSDQRVDYWDLETGKIIQHFEMGAPVLSMVLSSDGSQVMAFNDAVLLAWEVKGAQPVARVTAPVGTKLVGGGFTAGKGIRAALARPAPGGTLVIVFDNTTRKFLMVDDKARKPIPIQMPHPGTTVGRVFFGPDCKRLVSWSEDRMFRTWDLEAKRLATTSVLAPGGAKSLAISHDFKRVMGAFGQPDVHVYDVDNGSELRTMKPQDIGNTDAVAFGSENGLAVAGGFGGVTRVLDLDEAKVKKELQAGSIVTAVALSPDAKTVLSGDFTGTLYLHKLVD
jgi:serine/threonine protein kinase